MKEYNSSRLIDTEKGLVATKREGLEQVGGKVKGIKGYYNLQSQYKLVAGM